MQYQNLFLHQKYKLIYCVLQYVDYLKDNIKRLEKAEKYFEKAKTSKNEDKKQYFIEYTKMYLERDENIDTFLKIKEEYENAYKVRQGKVDNLYNEIKEAFCDVKVLKQIDTGINRIQRTEIIEKTSLTEITLGNGNVNIDITLKDELFYKVLTEISGVNIDNEGDLFSIISELAVTKKEYDKIAYALEEVKHKGYGIVTPSIEELILDEPEMVKQGSRFGVKLKAKAPSIHMIRADIETEVSPIVGSEKQSEELVNYLLSEFENDTQKIWESNIFGKSLHELVNEGLQNKLCKMPEDAQMKLQETLERIVNEGSGGLICIIL